MLIIYLPANLAMNDILKVFFPVKPTGSTTWGIEVLSVSLTANIVQLSTSEALNAYGEPFVHSNYYNTE